MRHGIIVKFLVYVLTCCALVAAVGSAAGIVEMESANLYVNGLDELQDQQFNSIADTIATDYATYYATKELGNLPAHVRNALFTNPTDRSDSKYWTLQLSQGEDVLVEAAPLSNCVFVQEFRVNALYPIIPTPPENPPEEPQPPDTPNPSDPVNDTPEEDSNIPTDYEYRETETLWLNNQLVSYDLYYYEAPEYVVTVYMQQEVLESSSLHLLTALHPYRNSFVAVFAISIIIAAAGLVFLCHQAGRAPEGKVRPGGLNMMPLDLHGLLVTVALWLLFALFSQLQRWIANEGPHQGNLSLAGANLFAIFIVGISFIFAFAAQLKLPKHYWWHHSGIGWLLDWILRGLRLLGRGIRQLFALMAVVWQWLLVALLMAVSVLTFSLLSPISPIFTWILVFDIILCVGIACYGGYAFGILLAGLRKMARGELSHQVPTKYLVGSFRTFALNLNSLSETAMDTAQKHLRSERMKADLITNVSHDIKTPLTSIINYVDLLQRDSDDKNRQQYLDILSYQSQQLKRLIGDLIELSKATSGNLQVELSTIDAAEAMNQALGEFAEQLEAAELTPIFAPPQEPVMIVADGKLFWRVISNLLSNAAKYAMPGTRLYVELSQFEDKVLLSLKNVSRQELHNGSEYLMERFVQGDTSRSTEGSGLGLNIAKSLMDVQNGKLQLTADGDLFKVTLVFPAGENS